MNNGQWMELRREIRPPKTRRRRCAAGIEAVWWPENSSWTMVPRLPREGSIAEVDQQTMTWRSCHQMGMASMQRAAEGILPRWQEHQGTGARAMECRSSMPRQQGQA